VLAEFQRADTEVFGLTTERRGEAELRFHPGPHAKISTAAQCTDNGRAG
jgi:hypothetical protein